MRSKAAEAAASLTAAQADSDSTTSLAARLLSHMEAATQRRNEALEQRKARSAAKQDLLLQRLVSLNTLVACRIQSLPRHGRLQLQLPSALRTSRCDPQVAFTLEPQPESVCKAETALCVFPLLAPLLELGLFLKPPAPLPVAATGCRWCCHK